MRILWIWIRNTVSKEHSSSPVISVQLKQKIIKILNTVSFICRIPWYKTNNSGSWKSSESHRFRINNTFCSSSSVYSVYTTETGDTVYGIFLFYLWIRIRIYSNCGSWSETLQSTAPPPPHFLINPHTHTPRCLEVEGPAAAWAERSGVRPGEGLPRLLLLLLLVARVGVDSWAWDSLGWLITSRYMPDK